MTDADLYAWAAAKQCWLLTENVKDFRPILLRALQTGGQTTGLLFTSNRTFPRSRQTPVRSSKPYMPGSPTARRWPR